MDKLKLIIAREYMAMVGRKSFIVMTILLPILMVALIAIPAGIAYLNDKGSDTETIAVIDESGRFGSAIPDNDMYHFVPLSADTVADAHKFYNDAKGSIAAVVVIPRDIDSTAQVNVYSENTINVALKNHITNAMSDTLT